MYYTDVRKTFCGIVMAEYLAVLGQRDQTVTLLWKLKNCMCWQ